MSRMNEWVGFSKQLSPSSQSSTEPQNINNKQAVTHKLCSMDL